LTLLPYWAPESRRVLVGPDRFYRDPRPDRGEVYPSVTAILRATQPEKDRAGLAAWRRHVGHCRAAEIVDLATKRGSFIHRLVERRLIGWPLPEDDSDDPVWQDPLWRSIAPMVELVRSCPNRVVEGMVWHDRAQYAGTFDCLVDIPGTGIVLIDWKTARKPKQRAYVADYVLQLAAYAAAIHHQWAEEVSEVWLVFAIKGGGQRMTFDRTALVKGYREFCERLKQYRRERP